jgi:CRP-like cAMP-binding protein
MLKLEDIQEILSIPLLGVIPESESVLKASNTGTPVIMDAESMAGQAYADAVSRFLGARLSEALELVAAQSQLRLDDRLLAALQHFAQRNGEPLPEGRVRLLLTQEDLARAVDASRQRVNQALRRLQTQGMVELGYRCIDIRRCPV